MSKIALALALSAIALLQAPAIAAAQPIRQSCTGVLISTANGYQLKPDANSDLWCDAYLSDQFVSKEAIRRVLHACKVGDRCRIAGMARGPGVFFWTQISSVSAAPAQ